MTTTQSQLGVGHSARGSGQRSRKGRRITRPRSLPGGRAVVGSLLIAASAVIVFAAYLDANAEPSTRFLVASEPISSGTVIEDVASAQTLFSSAPLSLVDGVAVHAIGVDDLESIVGHTVVASLGAGELLQRSALLDGGRASAGHVMSFALPASDAVAGSLVPGETIDVLSTTRSGREPATSYVVRGVPVLAVGSGGTGSSVVLTVALEDVAQVQALGHAVHTATVFVAATRAGDQPADRELPDPYVEPSLPDERGEPHVSDDEADGDAGEGAGADTDQEGGVPTGADADSGTGADDG